MGKLSVYSRTSRLRLFTRSEIDHIISRGGFITANSKWPQPRQISLTIEGIEKSIEDWASIYGSNCKKAYERFMQAPADWKPNDIFKREYLVTESTERTNWVVPMDLVVQHTEDAPALEVIEWMHGQLPDLRTEAVTIEAGWSYISATTKGRTIYSVMWPTTADRNLRGLGIQSARGCLVRRVSAWMPARFEGIYNEPGLKPLRHLEEELGIERNPNRKIR